jgi:ribosomal protein S6
MKHYEIVLLIHPDQDSTIDNISTEFTDLIKNLVGKCIATKIGANVL